MHTMRVGIDGVFYSLTHVPDLVRYGSKPLREIRARPALGAELKNRLRDFSAAVAYAPHQVYIGNLAPEALAELPGPWYAKLIEGAVERGQFGDLVDQGTFYTHLAGADQFDLVSFDEKWFRDQPANGPLRRAPRLRSLARRFARKARWRFIRVNVSSALSRGRTPRTRVSSQKSCSKTSPPR